MYGIINALKLFQPSWIKEDSEVGVLVLKRQKQTLFEICYQTSYFMSTYWQNIRTQLLILDTLFSNYLRANEHVQGEPIRTIQVKCTSSNLPKLVFVLEISPDVLRSICLNGIIEQYVDLTT